MDSLVNNEDHSGSITGIIVCQGSRDCSEIPFRSHCRIVTRDIDGSIKILDDQGMLANDARVGMGIQLGPTA